MKESGGATQLSTVLAVGGLRAGPLPRQPRLGAGHPAAARRPAAGDSAAWACVWSTCATWPSCTSAAMESTREGAGERFIAAGDFLWMKDIAAILRERLGARASKVTTRSDAELRHPPPRLFHASDAQPDPDARPPQRLQRRPRRGGRLGMELRPAAVDHRRLRQESLGLRRTEKPMSTALWFAALLAVGVGDRPLLPRREIHPDPPLPPRAAQALRQRPSSPKEPCASPGTSPRWPGGASLPFSPPSPPAKRPRRGPSSCRSSRSPSPSTPP